MAAAAPVRAQEKDPALEQLYVANSAYNRKLYPVAIGQYEAFLKKNSKHPKVDQARYGLGLSQYALKLYDKAAQQFGLLLKKKELDEEIDRNRLVILQGQCLLHTGKAAEAKKLLVEAIERLKPGTYRIGAMASVADLCFDERNWGETLDWTRKVLAAKAEPGQVSRALYQQGYALYRMKRIKEAIETLLKLKEQAKDGVWKTRAVYLLGECYAGSGQLEEAEGAYKTALEGLAGPDAAEGLFRLAKVRFRLKKYAEAAADFQTYHKRKPKPPRTREATLYIGRCALERGDTRNTERTLSGLTNEEDAIAASASLWLARMHSRKGKHDRAAEILEKATQRFGRTSVIDELEFDYACALMQRGTPDWKKAAERLQQIERRRNFPRMAAVLSQWAVCLHRMKQYDQSQKMTERFMKSHAEDELVGDVRFVRAENLFLMNKLDDALKGYGEFIAAHPDHKNRMAASYRVALILHDQGKWEESLARARPVLAEKPQGRLFEQLSFVVGDCLFRQSKWAEAVEPLEAFLASYVKSKGRNTQVNRSLNVDTALMQLAVAYDNLEQRDKALVHLKTLTTQYEPGGTPHLPLALAERGRLSYEAGDLKTARQALERFNQIRAEGKESFKKASAQHARVLYFLGWVAASEGNHEEAARHYGEVVKQHQRDELAADASLQQGIAWVNAGNYQAAAGHFPEMLRRYPKHPEAARAVYYTGLSLARLKNWRSASGHFKRVVEQHPKAEFADRALYEWAWCERAMERKKEAVQLYERLLTAYPQSSLRVKVQSEMAELNLDSGAQDKVIAQLTSELATVKDEAMRENLRYQIASAHFKKGDHENSAPLFEQLAADFPASKRIASMLFQAGESRLALDETVAARENYLAASKLDSKRVPAEIAESIQMRLGETQTFSQQYREAEQTFRFFLQRFRESPWTRNAQYGVGYALEMQGKYKEAISEYHKLTSLKGVSPKPNKPRKGVRKAKDPDKPDLWMVRARFQIGECLFNEQKYEEAVAAFVHVDVNFQAYPEWQAKAVLEIGRVLLAQKKYDDATEQLKEVIRRFSKEKAAGVAKQLLDEMRSLKRE